MSDRAKFMETLRSVAEISQRTGTQLTRAEINKYFEDMNLSPEQEEMVYQYLLNPTTEDSTSEEEESETKEYEEVTSNDIATESSTLSEETSKFLQMYMEEISELPRLSTAEEEAMYQRLLGGDEYVIQPISDHWLSNVVELAKNYSKEKVNLEDLIQEGNIGLMKAVDKFEYKKDY